MFGFKWRELLIERGINTDVKIKEVKFQPQMNRDKNYNDLRIESFEIIVITFYKLSVYCIYANVHPSPATKEAGEG